MKMFKDSGIEMKSESTTYDDKYIFHLLFFFYYPICELV